SRGGRTRCWTRGGSSRSWCRDRGPGRVRDMGFPPCEPPEAGSPPTRVRYRVLTSLCLAAALAYIPRNCLGVAEGDIRASLGLSKNEMSVVMSSFFITYALLQIPSGWLAHVWGTRRALPLFAAAWSVASGLTALAGLPLLLLARLGMGRAQA